MSPSVRAMLVLIVLGVGGFVVLGIIGAVVVLSAINRANSQVALVATQAVDTPTSVPTFTPSATPTLKPVDTATSTPTDTPAPTNTPVPPTATNTAAPLPPTNTPRPRPTNTPLPPPPPTEAPKPSVDFKVIEARLFGAVENGGTSVNGSLQTCGNLNAFFIKVIDKNGSPLDGIIVSRVFAANVGLRPTGAKGPGKTEDDTGDGNQFYIARDVSGRTYTSETTRSMSTLNDIPNGDLIAGGYCRDDAECNFRKANNQLCRRHYSYSVIFQRQW